MTPFNATPFQVAYQMAYENNRWKDMYFVCDCNTGYSANTIRDIDFWLDVRLELKRIQDERIRNKRTRRV